MMNLDCGLSEKEYAELLSLIEAQSSIEQAVLFGSRAKGTFKSGSDVDIALKGAALSHADVVNLSYALNQESCLPYHFDIIDYNTIDNAALRDHIDRVGKVLFTCN
jgi:predicted nucleotidyltransferase